MDLELRNLDDDVVRALQARAERRGIGLDEEVKRTLRASVEAQREAYLKRLRALQAAARAHAVDGEAAMPGDRDRTP